MLNVVDIIIIGIVLFGAVRGIIKGLVHELFSLIGVLAGVALAFYYGQDLAVYISDYIETGEAVLLLIAYFLLFFGVLLIAWIIGFALTKLLGILALGLINRILGALFGIAKSLFFLIILLHVSRPFASDFFDESEKVRDSFMFRKLASVEKTIGLWLLPDRETNPNRESL